MRGLEEISEEQAEADSQFLSYCIDKLDLYGVHFIKCLPFPHPTIKPVAPFKLSTQPGAGSFHAAVTIQKLRLLTKNMI